MKVCQLISISDDPITRITATNRYKIYTFCGPEMSDRRNALNHKYSKAMISVVCTY
jgi:hypothetical protein